MIIILRSDATKEQADILLDIIAEHGLKPLYMPGSERTVIGALGDERVLAPLELEAFPFVERVLQVLSPYKLASREKHPGGSTVTVGGVPFGPGTFTIVAGPCAVESEAQIGEAARRVKAAGAHLLRGGAYKPRTSPYSFQGLEEEGLRLLAAAGREAGLPVVTEIMDVSDLELVARHADMLQVGARNMQDYRLLKELGKAGKPVLLKRGMSATYEELLLSAEYLLKEGNEQVILCERGIKTFEHGTRNTLDLNAVPYLRRQSHLPVIVDPSHGAGLRDLVAPMAKAAAAAGADGVMVEVHPDPGRALSDGAQALDPDGFAELVGSLRDHAALEGRRLA